MGSPSRIGPIFRALSAAYSSSSAITSAHPTMCSALPPHSMHTCPIERKAGGSGRDAGAQADRRVAGAPQSCARPTNTNPPAHTHTPVRRARPTPYALRRGGGRHSASGSGSNLLREIFRRDRWVGHQLSSGPLRAAVQLRVAVPLEKAARAGTVCVRGGRTSHRGFGEGKRALPREIQRSASWQRPPLTCHALDPTPSHRQAMPCIGINGVEPAAEASSNAQMSSSMVLLTGARRLRSLSAAEP